MAQRLDASTPAEPSACAGAPRSLFPRRHSHGAMTSPRQIPRFAARAACSSPTYAREYRRYAKAQPSRHHPGVQLDSRAPAHSDRAPVAVAAASFAAHRARSDLFCERPCRVLPAGPPSSLRSALLCLLRRVDPLEAHPLSGDVERIPSTTCACPLSACTASLRWSNARAACVHRSISSPARAMIAPVSILVTAPAASATHTTATMARPLRRRLLRALPFRLIVLAPSRPALSVFFSLVPRFHRSFPALPGIHRSGFLLPFLEGHSHD